MQIWTNTKTIKSAGLAVVFACLMFINGCSIFDEPRVRLGSYATNTPGTNFLDANSLGRHSYGNFLFENNGIVYTCRGGHIDIAHLRIGADNVKFLYNKVRKNLLKGKPYLTFKLNVEPSTYFVTFDYPPDWKNKTDKDKQKEADELAMEVSQYFTFTMTTWHEVLTWYGYKCMGVLPEQPSAFSWEDIYSNLVGLRIGAEALRDEKHSYDTAVTIAIKKELENLGVQSASRARNASEKMRGKWYTGIILVDMKVRNFDIGTDDGFVTPMLVPGECNDAEPQSYPVPTLDKFHKYGFKMVLEAEPREFESNKILSILFPDGKHKRVQPVRDIPIILSQIQNGSGKKTLIEQAENNVHVVR
jgi:hypothetical protein